jgi:hypothetical protein
VGPVQPARLLLQAAQSVRQLQSVQHVYLAELFNQECVHNAAYSSMVVPCALQLLCAPPAIRQYICI